MSIKNDPRVEKSIRRLKAMGLTGKLIEVNEKYVVLAITNESIMRTIARIVDKNFTYPKHHVEIDWDLGILEVHIWKGETPHRIKEMVMQKWEMKKSR